MIDLERVDLVLKIIKLNENKILESYYNLWIKKISENHTFQEIYDHLKVHLHHKKEDYNGWIASAENLYNIYITKGINLDSDLLKKYKQILNDYSAKIGFKKNDIKKINQLEDKFSKRFSRWELDYIKDNVEWFKKIINISYNDKKVKELIVGVNDSEVIYLAKKWEENNGFNKSEYFFKSGHIYKAKGNLSKLKFENVSGFNQVLNCGVEINNNLRLQFEELLNIKPSIKTSLDSCLKKLEKV